MGLGYVTYKVQMRRGDDFCFAADLTEASATIYLMDDEGEETSTQWQTADASHRVRDAAELLADEEDEIVSVDADAAS